MCNRKFKILAQLRYHFDNECGRTFKCNYCKLTYTSISALSRHNSKHHQTVAIEETEKI